MQKTDYIDPEKVKTLSGLFRERVERSPHAVAYQFYSRQTQSWIKYTWQDMAQHVSRWQSAMESQGLKAGDRVAIMSRNSPFWVMVDQACLGLGLVSVPLYVNDRADNVAYIIDNSAVKLLVIEGKDQWQQLKEHVPAMHTVDKIVAIDSLEDIEESRFINSQEWLPEEGEMLRESECVANELASIVYTSGTTGNPKGVMLNHTNMLWDADASLQTVTVYPNDVFLSFLPLSHMLERSIGYYLPMIAGATVCYARSIPELAEDLRNLKPTIMISVPRIFERVYTRIQGQLEKKSPIAKKLFHSAVSVGWKRFEYQQGRMSWRPSLLFWPLLRSLVADKIMQAMGGRIRVAISGGAPLSFEVAQLFIALGLPICQGYGLTEASPVISGNRLENNDPRGVGLPLPGLEVRIGDKDELQVKGPNVMIGYWDNEKATEETFQDGWLCTGDKVRMENGHIYITGRLKEIIVLANGEKVPPADMELAISNDALFEQVIVLGEGKPYLTAICILNPEAWREFAKQNGFSADQCSTQDNSQLHNKLITRVQSLTKNFPGYAQIRKLTVHLDPWTVENGLITPTLKLKRAKIVQQHQQDLNWLYQGH